MIDKIERMFIEFLHSPRFFYPCGGFFGHVNSLCFVKKAVYRSCG